MQRTTATVPIAKPIQTKTNGCCSHHTTSTAPISRRMRPPIKATGGAGTADFTSRTTMLVCGWWILKHWSTLPTPTIVFPCMRKRPSPITSPTARTAHRSIPASTTSVGFRFSGQWSITTGLRTPRAFQPASTWFNLTLTFLTDCEAPSCPVFFP